MSRIDLHHILQLLIGMFSLELSAISKVFVTDLSMCLFAGKDIAQKLLLF